MRQRIPWAIVIYAAVAAVGVAGIFIWDQLSRPSPTPNLNDPVVRARAAAQSITGEPTVRRVVVDEPTGRVIVEARSKYYNAAASRDENRQYLATEGRLIIQLILHDLPEIPGVEVDLFEGRHRLATISGRPDQHYDQYPVAYEGDLAAAPAQPAGSRSQVIIGMSQEPETLHPLFAAGQASAVVRSTLFVQDVARDNAGRVFAQGVEALPTLKAGTWRLDGEGMALTWKLKARTWQDGQPVTCEDYVFTHAVARDPRVPVVTRDLTNRIARVECPAGAKALVVRVVWKERYPYADLAITEFGALPRHILEPAYLQHPSKLNDTAFGRIPQATIGDGAYRLVEWRRGASLTVESVDAHAIFGTPKIARITWRFIPDPKVLVADLVSGTIDAIGTGSLSVEDAVHLVDQASSRVRVSFEPGLTWEHVDLNVDSPLLQDVRVRRAIAYAINRDQLVRELFHGKLGVSHTYLPPKHPGYTADVPTYPYDRPRAKALLQEAGFVPGLDGILRNTVGQQFVLTLVTTSGNPMRSEVAQRIRRDLGQVGIEVNIQTVPPEVLFSEMTHRRKFTELALYAWGMTLTADCEYLYTSNGIPSESNGWTGQNFTRYKSAGMDTVCAAANGELDPVKRTQLLAKSAGIFSRDLPAIPLYVGPSIAAAKAALHGLAAVQLPGPASAYETWNASKWFWE